MCIKVNGKIKTTDMKLLLIIPIILLSCSNKTNILPSVKGTLVSIEVHIPKNKVLFNGSWRAIFLLDDSSIVKKNWHRLPVDHSLVVGHRYIIK
jgi:hypothetical protein